eukprot:gene8087-10955_t
MHIPTVNILELPANMKKNILASLRYSIIRATSVPAPFVGKNSVYLIGGRSIIELLVIIAVFVVVLGMFTIGKDGSANGRVTDFVMAATVIISLRNNILSVLIGMGYERVLLFHKSLAVLAVCCMITHGVSEGFNSSGLACGVLMGCMGIVYFLVKPFSFNLFYFLHIAIFFGTVIAGWLHFAIYFPYCSIAWIVDIGLRYLITMKKVSATTTLLPGDIIKLNFPKIFSYQPGQYCFIMIKSINVYEFHPFSISSSPHEESMTFHIRALGDWTQKLQSIVSESNSKEIQLEIRIEGPYGNSMIDIEGDQYEVIMLISGGIGITPLLSTWNYLVNEQAKGRTLRKVIFVSSAKDEDVLKALNENRMTSIAEYVKTNNRFTSKNRVSPIDYAENDANFNSRSEGIKTLELDSLNIFHSELYTSKKSTNDLERNGSNNIFNGRPNLPDLFTRTSSFCMNQDIKRVGVVVCGPTSLINEVVDICHASLLTYSGIRFDVHKEIFDL